MSKGVTASGKEYIVTHLYADGIELDDCTGVFVPVNDITIVSYNVALSCSRRLEKERQEMQAKSLAKGGTQCN